MSATDSSPAPLASVIVPCREGLGATRSCVTALMRHTKPPWELIAVEDGSCAAVAAYLRGVQDAAPVPVVIVNDPAARGGFAASRRGMFAARGEYLIFLDGNAVVADAWLDQLGALAESDPWIGMAGTMSDDAEPPQRVEPPPDARPDAMDRFARRWRAEHLGQWSLVEGLSGPCLLMKRRMLEAIGGLGEGPEPTSLGDLTVRARRAGFALAVAHDLFVHRQRERMPAGPGTEAVVADRREGRGPTDLPVGRMRVSLTMIVRDEEANLPACLESAAGLFDEIVVVDTGSTDRTAEIARSVGARVFDFVWVDDFAAARNAALARATGDYAFWLDADDVIDPPERRRLGSLLAGLRAGDEAAYVVRCACDPEPGGGGATVVDHVRLFPVREEIRWMYAVHEQILPALRQAGVPVRWTDVTVRHTGYTDPEIRGRKLGRDEAILRAELAERPDDPFVRFNLGSIAVEREDWPEALGLLRASLAGSAPEDSITRKLYALVARCHQALGEIDSALVACEEGLALDPDDAELLFRKAVVHRRRGEAVEAEACWGRVLTRRRPEKFASVDAGIFGHLTRRNLAALAEERGDLAAAARLWQEVLAECPGDPEAVAMRDRMGGAFEAGPPGGGAA